MKNQIKIDGVTYVAKVYMQEDDACLVRTQSAGVFFGTLPNWNNGKIGTMHNATRIFYWVGAASLSQMAMEGVTHPNDCKFAVEVPIIYLTEIIEVLPLTRAAYKNLAAVPKWKV